jgi:hypothetical protein
MHLKVRNGSSRSNNSINNLKIESKIYRFDIKFIIYILSFLLTNQTVLAGLFENIIIYGFQE